MSAKEVAVRQKRAGRPRIEDGVRKGPDTKREALINVAAELFHKRGYTATTVRDIARVAGISQGTLYYYFKSKPDILIALHNLLATELIPPLYDVLRSELPTDEKLRRVMHIEMAMIARRPIHAVALREGRRALSNEDAAMIISKRDEVDRIIDAILQEGIAAGTLRDIPVKMARLAMMGMANYFVEWFNPQGPATVDEIADHFSDIFLRGVGKHSSAC